MDEMREWAGSECGEHAAVNVEDLAVNEVRRTGGKEDASALQLFDPAPAAIS